jgi:hypothetical protein
MESALGTMEILVVTRVVPMLLPRVFDDNIGLIAEIIGRTPRVGCITIAWVTFAVSFIRSPASAQADRGEQRGYNNQ